MDVFMQTLITAFVEGWQAGYDGSGYESNPCQACQKQRQVWWSGWFDGSAERAAEQRREARFAAGIQPKHKLTTAHAL